MDFRPVFSSRGSAWIPELVVARGPREIGSTGDGSYNDLFGYAWLLFIDAEDKVLRMFQAQSSGPWRIGSGGSPNWVEVDVPEIHHDPFKIRHLSLAFDQSARSVIAYEIDNEVWVRQWDASTAQYVMRGPWPGVDPTLIMDATVNYSVEDSDVLLFHLTTDRLNVIMRAQRELYSTAHNIHTLTSAGFIDQAVALPYKIEVVGSTSSSPNDTSIILRSEIYPAYLRDSIGTVSAYAPTGGEYKPLVVIRQLGTDTIGTAHVSTPSSGDYRPLNVQISLVTDDVGTALVSPPQSGTYISTVIIQHLDTDNLGTATSYPPPSGSYVIAVITYTATADTIGTATVTPPSGGSYV